MVIIADLVYLLAALVYAPYLLYEMIVLRKNRSGWGEKLLGPRAALTSKDARRLWIHGVSLGEINAARQLVRELATRAPDLEIVISTTTDTGYARACELFGAERVFRYPLDFSWAVEAALDRINPAVIVLMELEVWLNLTTLAARRGIPVTVVNGRFTERSARRLGWLGGISRRMFAALTWVGAQDEPTAARFAAAGVPRERVSVTGSLKWDTATIADRIPGQEALATALGLSASQPVWVCGSTGPGEEEMLLAAYADLRADFLDLQLVIVPRKPERFEEVARLIADRSFICRRRSQLPDGQVPPPCPENVVWLGDTMGELRKFYALATVVFIGRSLVPMGGSDPMEVAALGKPMIAGPHMANFLLPTQALKAAGALRSVTRADGLAAAAQDLLRQARDGANPGAAGQNTVRQQQGATERTIGELLRVRMKNAK